MCWLTETTRVIDILEKELRLLGRDIYLWLNGLLELQTTNTLISLRSFSYSPEESGVEGQTLPPLNPAYNDSGDLIKVRK